MIQGLMNNFRKTNNAKLRLDIAKEIRALKESGGLRHSKRKKTEPPPPVVLPEVDPAPPVPNALLGTIDTEGT